MSDLIADDIQITLTFKRIIEDGARVNQRDKDHLTAEITDINGSQEISNALVFHIHDELGIDIREEGVGSYKMVARIDDEDI